MAFHEFLRNALICGVLTVVASACLADLPVFPKRPLILQNESGTEIETYCVAPLYIKSFYNNKLDMQDLQYSLFLRWPVRIGKDDGYAKIRKKDLDMDVTTVFGIPLWMKPKGEGVSWTALLFLKRGYKPALWKKGLDPRFTNTVPMKEGDSEDDLKLLLATTKDRNRLLELYDVQRVEREWPIVDEYTNEDRELLRKCYYDEDLQP